MSSSSHRPIAIFFIASIALACTGERAPRVLLARADSTDATFSSNDVVTIVPATVPTIALGAPQEVVRDSFRVATGLAVRHAEAFVLDVARDPHVSQVDLREKVTVRRFLSHVAPNGDTLAPLALAIRDTAASAELLLLDARGKRIIGSMLAERSLHSPLRYYDLETVLAPSDNPLGLAVASWGVALSGTLTRGTRFALSLDALRWTIWRDTTALVHGLPLDSFLRNISTSSLVVMAPHRRVLLLPSRYHRAWTVVDVDARTATQVVFGDAPIPPATLRIAEDSSVRISWREDARLHFVSASPSHSVAVLLDCDCRSDGTDSLVARTRLWVVSWEGHPLATLVSPVPLMSAALSTDAQQLIATVQDGDWERLVAWSLPREVMALIGRGSPVPQ